MAVDIHMHIVENYQIIKEDIFDGRNYEWFNDITLKDKDIYKKLNIKAGFSPKTPKNLIEYISKLDYYDFYYFKVGDFLDWFTGYRPDLDAGWVHTYTKWKMEQYDYIPGEDEFYHYLDKEHIPEDMHFVTIANKYDCNYWLFEYLIKNNISHTADITYYFDC